MIFQQGALVQPCFEKILPGRIVLKSVLWGKQRRNGLFVFLSRPALPGTPLTAEVDVPERKPQR